jgi:hypothetical protein
MIKNFKFKIFIFENKSDLIIFQKRSNLDLNLEIILIRVQFLNYTSVIRKHCEIM